MGGNAMDVYRVCECMAGVDLGVATSVLATFLGSDPITVGGTEEQKARWMGRIAEEGILFAYGATEPDAGSDLGALKTVAEPIGDDGAVTGYRITGAKQWISNGGVAELATVLALAPAGPTWFVVPHDADGLHPGLAGAQARHPALEHRGALPRGRRGSGAGPGRRRRGSGSPAGPAGLRLHAPHGGGVRPRRRLGGARPRDPVLPGADAGGRPAQREAGLHPQADRPPRRRAGGRARRDRGDGRAHRRRRGHPEHRGRDRQVPRDGGRQRRRGRGDPGTRRLRLHPRVRRREDPARRADHDDLRGHLGDHGDDDRARSLAAAPQDARRPLPRDRARTRGPSGAASAADRRARPPRARRTARGLPRGAPDAPPARAAAPRRRSRRGPRARRALARRAARGRRRGRRREGLHALRRGRARDDEPRSPPARRRSRSPPTACAGSVPRRAATPPRSPPGWACPPSTPHRPA